MIKDKTERGINKSKVGCQKTKNKKEIKRKPRKEEKRKRSLAILDDLRAVCGCPLRGVQLGIPMTHPKTNISQQFNARSISVFPLIRWSIEQLSGPGCYSFSAAERVKFNWLKMSMGMAPQCLSYESSFTVFISPRWQVSQWIKTGWCISWTPPWSARWTRMASSLLCWGLTTWPPCGLWAVTPAWTSARWGKRDKSRRCDWWWSKSSLSAEPWWLCGVEPAGRSGRNWFREGLKSQWINEWIRRKWTLLQSLKWIRDLSEPWHPFGIDTVSQIV